MASVGVVGSAVDSPLQVDSGGRVIAGQQVQQAQQEVGVGLAAVRTVSGLGQRQSVGNRVHLEQQRRHVGQRYVRVPVGSGAERSPETVDPVGHFAVRSPVQTGQGVEQPGRADFLQVGRQI